MKRVISMFCMLVAIIFMMTPYGITMAFAPSPTVRITQTYSYFSELPWGYGSWFPMITVVLSIIIFVLLFFNNKKVKKSVEISLIICIVASLLSWGIFHSYSFVGVCVLFLHITVLALQSLWIHKKERT